MRAERAVQAGAVASVGATLVLAGAAAVRVWTGGASTPPWVTVSLYGLVAVLALAGMLLALRVARGAWRPPAPVGLRHPGSVATSDGELTAEAALAAEAPASSRLERLQVDTLNARRMIAVGDVEWLEASGNYVRLHLAGESFLYRATLTRLEGELPASFVRVHRSAVVNLDVVRRIEPFDSGDADLVLRSGARVRMSRRYSRRFDELSGRR